MERLDINVSHSEITQLINEVDNNGDGEIDYRETLDHFERLARSYSHGKRRISVFGRNSQTNDTTSLTNQHKQILISTLKCAGVSCLNTEAGSVLTLPFENTTLRNVIWHKYIKDETKESQSRTFIIEHFSKKQPSLRYCEELPWHLKKVRCIICAMVLNPNQLCHISRNLFHTTQQSGQGLARTEENPRRLEDTGHYVQL